MRGALILAAVGALAGCATFPYRPAAALPLVAAHRAGTADAPENTLEAVRQALGRHADILWLSVQLSSDSVPVLYRPADLAELTDSTGPVSGRTAAELAKANAGWTYKRIDANGFEQYPYRQNPAGIPALRDALRAIPAGVAVVLDMKALPAAPQAQAVAAVLTEESAWDRVLLYSTDASYQAAFAAYPQARVFESRDATRRRLAGVLLGEGCVDPPARPVWAAFELHRPLTVLEKFTLGEGKSEVTATLWTPATVACFRSKAQARIFAIGVNGGEDYQTAACLGIDAVVSDSPSRMADVRAALPAPVLCPK